MAVAPRTRRFSIEEYDRMVEVGILGADDHVELIEGERREPSASAYRDVRTLRGDDRVAPLAFPDPTLPLPEILG